MSFKLVTGDPLIMKTLIDFMSTITPTCYIQVNDHGMNIGCVKDTTISKILIQRDRLELFRSSGLKSMVLNISQLSSLLKYVGKSNIMMMNNNEDKLVISTTGLSKVTTTISTLKEQIIEFKTPVGYENGVLVDTSEFSKVCKNIGLNGLITLEMVGDFGLKITMGVSHMVERVVILGTPEEDTTSNYKERFHSSDLIRIGKLSSVSPKIRIYLMKGLPAKIVAFTQLGLFEMFVKCYSE